MYCSDYIGTDCRRKDDYTKEEDEYMLKMYLEDWSQSDDKSFIEYGYEDDSDNMDYNIRDIIINHNYKNKCHIINKSYHKHYTRKTKQAYLSKNKNKQYVLHNSIRNLM